MGYRSVHSQNRPSRNLNPSVDTSNWRGRASIKKAVVIDVGRVLASLPPSLMRKAKRIMAGERVAELTPKEKVILSMMLGDYR